jgi:putative restriction endonuclease
MSREQILQLFDNLGIWTQGDQRAPHKPLLVLYALARWSRGDHAAISFHDLDPDLTSLLKEFGPPRQSYHPEYPFWYLQNDGVWTLHGTQDLEMRKGKNQPPKSELIAHKVTGEFSKDVQEALDADDSLAWEISTRLLESHFPESIHSDILEAVGFNLGSIIRKGQTRDPKFRQRVLTTYEYRCAVCGFNVRLGSVSIALDAAHIRWHQAQGPDTEINGLALCTLHHKTFDLGAFTINSERILLVSDQANGTNGFEDLLMKHHGNCIRAPQRPEHRPAPHFLDWHQREVFKGLARHVGNAMI